MGKPVVLDLETKKSFREVERRKPEDLGVSVVGTYSYASDEFRAFREEQFDQLFRLLESASLIIGFNITEFDLPVLRPYYVGDLMKIPRLDLLTTVHEEIGNQAVGGRVNGKFVSLKHILIQGDVVEILTNKNQRPRRAWIKIVKSVKARQKIRKSLKKIEDLPSLFFRSFKPEVTEEQGLLVESEEFPTAYCVLAKCCNPLPGEKIIGILTKRKIISAHREDCRQAVKEQERWLPVNWKEAFNQKIKFFVNAKERSGLLADLLHTIAQAGFEVKEAKAKLVDLEHAQGSFTIIPRDLEHLKELVRRVNKVRGVTKVFFE